MSIKLFELGKLIPYVDLDLEVHMYHKRSDVKGCVTPVLQILHDSSLHCRHAVPIKTGFLTLQSTTIPW